MRCRNCGLLGHKTQVCPSYGPWYPAPDKTKEDYEKLRIKIANLVAADVIAEHEGRALQDSYEKPKKRRIRKTDERHDGGDAASGPRSGGAGEAATA